MLTAMFLASTGIFDPTMCSLGVFSKGLAPSDVDRTFPCNSSCSDQSGSCSPSFGCVAASRRVCAPLPVATSRARPCACPRSGSLMPTRRSCSPSPALQVYGRLPVIVPWVCARLTSLAMPFHVRARPCHSPRVPTPRAWLWLSQLRQQVQPRRLPRPSAVRVNV